MCLICNIGGIDSKHTCMMYEREGFHSECRYE